MFKLLQKTSKKNVSQIIIVIVLTIILISIVMNKDMIFGRNYLGYDACDPRAEIKSTLTNLDFTKKEYCNPNSSTWTIKCYEDMYAFTWHEFTERTAYVQVISDKYIFGNKNVQIGMSKRDIKKIFRKSKRSTSYKEDQVFVLNEDGSITKQHIDRYFDNTYDSSLGFIYDENDNVKYIYVGYGL